MLKILIPVLVATLVLPGALTAQHVAGPKGTVAGIAPPPPPAPVPQPQSSLFYPPPGQFLYGSIPVVVFPDGRVYADFGYGYEQITRNCAAQQYVQPNTAVQPLPVQPAPGAPVTTPATSQQQVAGPCWTTDARGQFSVRR